MVFIPVAEACRALCDLRTVHFFPDKKAPQGFNLRGDTYGDRWDGLDLSSMLCRDISGRIGIWQGDPQNSQVCLFCYAASSTSGSIWVFSKCKTRQLFTAWRVLRNWSGRGSYQRNEAPIVIALPHISEAINPPALAGLNRGCYRRASHLCLP